MKRLLVWIVCAAACRSGLADTYRDYKIAMDQEQSTVVYNPYGALDTDFTAGRWWGSVGDDSGRNFPNQSRQKRSIYGMWLKLKYPKTAAADGDTYTADSTGGNAFPEVWRKKDGSELIFRGPGIAPRDYFWMKVPKTDDTDLRNRFFAQLYADSGKPDVPNDGTWEKISGQGSAVASSERPASPKPAEPPAEIRQKTFLFAQAVEDSAAYSAEVKKAVGLGAEYYGKPYFLGGSDSGSGGFFTFWLLNPTDRSFRAFSLDITKPAGEALMKTVLFAFEQKAQWVAVYVQAGTQDRPLYITVYP
jgi:hypothetical protein